MTVESHGVSDTHKVIFNLRVFTMNAHFFYRPCILPLTLAAILAANDAARADTWANSNTYTNTNTYTYTNVETITNTETNTNTNTRTCTHNGVPLDCDTLEPLPLSQTNPAVNCPERRFEVIYGRYCDHRITTLRFQPVKIQHAYDGAGFTAGTGLIEAFDMNDNGDIVGQAMTSGGEKHAVQLNIGAFYFSNHYFSDLGTPRLTSVATAISNELTVVGATQPSIDATSNVDAIWHSQLGGFRMLNALGGNSGAATGLARNSMYTEFAVGYGKWPASGGGDDAEHGFVWSFDGRATTVEVIGTSGQSNRALAVNDSKIAVGHATAGGVKNAFWWQSNAPTLLLDYGNYASAALDINNNLSPKIVGFAFDAAGKKRATLWQGTNFTALPALPNRSSSMATAISDGGDIVGQSGPRAAIWRDGNVFDLNTLLDTTLPTTLTKAIDINRHGRILAKGADGAFYVLIPTETL